MELAARAAAASGTVDADVCVIGAGPAGITIARELGRMDTDVLLLESGVPHIDDRIQELNGGDVVGDAYAGLRATRCRAAGGTTALWNTPIAGSPGAKYVPLDPIDFEVLPDVPRSGWPFDHLHLAPWYGRAQSICGLGAFAYDAADWLDAEAAPLPFGDGVHTGVYQFGPVRDLAARNLAALHTAHNVRMCCDATVTALEPDARRETVAAATVVTAAGPLRVRARTFVLAGGAVENARLLLLAGLGNRHDLVGRCFMEHPRDYALTLHPTSNALFRAASFYDMREIAPGTFVGGRLGLDADVLRKEALPNASATLLPAAAGRGPAAAILRRLRRGRKEGYGWSRARDIDRAYDRFRVIINVEQRPHPENRITLGSARDALGMPRAVLHWRWRDDDHAGLERVRARFAAALRRHGHVDVRADLPPDPNAHHHAGTTRMHEDPRHGVVDPNCRVHGTSNLFVAGASVFPTAGFANPTLTIVAMAARLAEHIGTTGQGQGQV